MITELDIVALSEPVPAENLEAGDVGTVVLVHDGGKAFTVEFTTFTGKTIAVITLDSDAVRPVRDREISHVRLVA